MAWGIVRWCSDLIKGLLILALFAGTARAQAACDPDLVSRARGPRHVAYSPREGRCEGLYAQDVAGGSVLTPISFIATFHEFDTAAAKSLILTWPAGDPTQAAGDGRLQVRAQSRRPKLYYRMDTVQPFTSGRYEWPTDVLNHLNLRQADLGVMAWTFQRVGERERPVHVPLRIGAGREAATGKAYALILVPGADIEEVHSAVLALNDKGHPLGQVSRRRELGLGLYPAGRSFSVSVPIPARAGLYRIDVDATLRNGMTTSVSVLFLNPDKS